VVFNGDYSDELFMSYQYASLAPNPEEFYEENKRLMKEIIYYDALRSDRTISGCGLEARTPFADMDFAKFCMSIPPELKMHKDKMEKYLLRKAFAGTGMLPDEVLYRRKEAFSDGVTGERSLYKIIQEYADKNISDDQFEQMAPGYTHCTPKSKEALFYRMFFDKYYPFLDEIIPHFWMPKASWVGAGVVDPSARTLSCYKQS
jgi:asparagine synthase (glutamine-hydrolysing)